MHNAQKRSIDDTCSHLGRLTDTFELSECQNYIQNAGTAYAHGSGSINML